MDNATYDELWAAIESASKLSGAGLANHKVTQKRQNAYRIMAHAFSLHSEAMGDTDDTMRRRATREYVETCDDSDDDRDEAVGLAAICTVGVFPGSNSGR